nr:uncharacterized protein LOC109178468 [Ipomoea batatas]
MLRQLLARKGPATDDSSNQNGSRPPPEDALTVRSPATPSAITLKFARLEFPRCDGREDPTVWLHRCEQFFKAQSTLVGEFVSLVAFHLTGVAQSWHLRLELEEPAMSWKQFKQRCYLRFGLGLRGNTLTSIRQHGRPVEEYSNKFQETLVRTTTVCQDQEVDLYTAGLDEWLRIDVENVHHINLDVAMNLARSFSRRQHWFSPSRAANPYFPPSSFAGGSHQSSRNCPHTTLHDLGTRGAGPSSNPPLERRLPRNEYQRRRANGLCFHYDERWTLAHNYRHIFLLVIDDIAPPSADGDLFVPDQSKLDHTDLERLEISLHAITDTGNGNTMRVNLLLNNRPITALIDSGSAHNFLDSVTAKRLGLIIRSCPFLQVVVANGERVTGLGICEDVQLQKDSNSFPVNLFVISLVGFEIVLGVHWLRTLGAILWDFTALTMTFMYGNRPVTWQGEQVPSGRLLNALQPQVSISNALEHILTDYSDLFQEPSALPPRSQCDHRITLVTSADLVSVRPYRYP